MKGVETECKSSKTYIDGAVALPTKVKTTVVTPIDETYSIVLNGSWINQNINSFPVLDKNAGIEEHEGHELSQLSNRLIVSDASDHIFGET